MIRVGTLRSLLSIVRRPEAWCSVLTSDGDESHRNLGATHRAGAMLVEPYGQARRPETVLTWEFGQFVVARAAYVALPD